MSWRRLQRTQIVKYVIRPNKFGEIKIYVNLVSGTYSPYYVIITLTSPATSYWCLAITRQ